MLELGKLTLDARHSLFDGVGFHAAKVTFILQLAKSRFRWKVVNSFDNSLAVSLDAGAILKVWPEALAYSLVSGSRTLIQC